MVGGDEVLVLAPLSVKPKYQKQGIGMALISEGHKIAKAVNGAVTYANEFDL